MVDSFIIGLTVFVLALFIGYYVVWKVTPALHAPLMAVTNGISSVIIVGAIISAGQSIDLNCARIMGIVALFLAGVNAFGGFLIAERMVKMFKKKKTKKEETS